MYAKKKYFTINFIHLIYKACQILSTYMNKCKCAHLHHSTIDHHHSYCTGYTALLKPFTVTSGEMCCHTILIHMYVV